MTNHGYDSWGLSDPGNATKLPFGIMGKLWFKHQHLGRPTFRQTQEIS